MCKDVTKMHQLIDTIYPSTSMGDYGLKEMLVMEAMKWKQKQMVEKAVKWLKENESSYWSSEYDTPQRLLDDFKKAMEE